MAQRRTPLQWAIYYINMQNVNMLEHILGMMKLNEMDELTLYQIFNILITVVQKNKLIAFIPILLKNFSNIMKNPGTNGEGIVEDVHFLTVLFGQKLIEDNTLLFMVNGLRLLVSIDQEKARELDIQEYDYSDLITDLITYGKVPWIYLALKRAEKIFGAQSHEFYKAFKNYISELGEEIIASDIGIFINKRFSETNEFAKKPVWVKDFTGKDVLPFESDFDINEIELEFNKEIQKQVDEIFNTLSIEELISKAISGLKTMGLTEESLKLSKDTLERQLKNKSKKEWKEILGTQIEQENRRKLMNNQKLFRLYGPAHPIANQHLDTDSLSDKFGGCRMFLCDLFDHDNEDEHIIYDWFTGLCQGCGLRIRIRWHAVRLPKLTGGWIGCFCSWQCVRDSLFQSEIPSRPLIDLFEDAVNQNGIQDRQL